MAAVVRNRFYPLIAFALVAVIVIGFARTYYLRFLTDLPPLKLLVQLHGLVFSAWLALFFTQTRLIARHNYVLHKKLGIAGAVLAAAVVSIGIVTALAGAPDPRPRPMGFTGLQFMFFPLSAITIFGVCVAAAIALRRHANLHKRLMLLGMIAVLGPGVARLMRLVGVGESFLLIQTLVTFGFVVWALLHDWFRNRIVHPVFAVGGAIVVFAWPLRAEIAGTETWLGIARWLTS
jgi:hypothetical protein